MDRLEQEYAGKLLVIRINIQEQAGRELGQAFGFQYTPTFIFFDEQGRETWRSIGELNENALRDEMSKR